MPEAGRLLDDAAGHLAARRYQDAHAAVMAALALEPLNPGAFYLLGVLAADHGNHLKAVELYGRSLTLAPAAAEVLAARARSRVALSDRDGALADARAATTGAKPSARTLDTIGVTHSRLGLHAEALPFFRRAIAIEPGEPSFLYNLGAALQFVGDFDGAEDAYRRAIAGAPAHVKAWSALVLMRKQTPARNDKSALEALFPNLTDADERQHIGHALAKTAEDMGDVDASMTWLAQAKAMKRADSRYDPAKLDALFAAAAETAQSIPQPSGDNAPIFIVGMPRTGTTLVDRILSSHSDVTSAGELTDFALEVKRAAKTPSSLVLDAETLRAARGVDLGEVGRSYIARARHVVGTARPRFVDKMPLNFFYAALILRALPNARVICVRRHPADTVLSNYRQLFATSFEYYQFAHDLGWTADYVARFASLMTVFRRTLPEDRFTEVWYEDLIANLEGEARRLTDFCDLPWQDACVNFHENAAPVATASSAQVRQPLYSTSVARWKRYRHHMGPALDVLAKAGLEVD